VSDAGRTSPGRNAKVSPSRVVNSSVPVGCVAPQSAI
jgi:hypothetical protein